MVNIPSVPEIITVNSEALQTQIRDLLPSQNGFGSELQASNVITPIIDLTRAAEGSSTPETLQTAIAYGSQTHVTINNTTSTIINATGFFKIIGVSSIRQQGSGAVNCTLSQTDGVTPKVIYEYIAYGGSGTSLAVNNFELVVFLAAGHSVTGSTNSTEANLSMSVRQIATGDGTLIQPNGFPL